MGKGLQQNMYDELGAVEVKQIDANRATAYIEMTSYDDNNDGTTLVQKWVGNWNLVQEGGSWKLNKPELKKLALRLRHNEARKQDSASFSNGNFSDYSSKFICA